jgi:hypothetical protein
VTARSASVDSCCCPACPSVSLGGPLGLGRTESREHRRTVGSPSGSRECSSEARPAHVTDEGGGQASLDQLTLDDLRWNHEAFTKRAEQSDTLAAGLLTASVAVGALIASALKDVPLPLGIGHPRRAGGGIPRAHSADGCGGTDRVLVVGGRTGAPTPQTTIRRAPSRTGTWIRRRDYLAAARLGPR